MEPLWFAEGNKMQCGTPQACEGAKFCPECVGCGRKRKTNSVSGKWLVPVLEKVCRWFQHLLHVLGIWKNIPNKKSTEKICVCKNTCWGFCADIFLNICLCKNRFWKNCANKFLEKMRRPGAKKHKLFIQLGVA